MKQWGAALAFFTLLLTPIVGRADVSPPDLSGCTGKKVAADCTTDDHARGRCAEITWSYINYGPHGPDGSRKEKMLACKPSPPLLDTVPVGALVGSFAFLLVAAGSAVVLVLRRRKRSA